MPESVHALRAGASVAWLRGRRPLGMVAVLWTLFGLAAGWGGCRWGYDKELADQTTHASRQLAADASALEGVLQKNESLPFVMALQPGVLRALQHPDDDEGIATLDRYLLQVASNTHLAAAYVVDARGLTISASNRGTPSSFVGSNYLFRPYVQAALGGSTGRFYGIGTTTADPGYFLARPVYGSPSSTNDGAPVGAVVIKIKLDDLEGTWTATDDRVALVDANDVVFLSNEKAWKYHSIESLSPQALDQIARSRQYVGHAIERLALDDQTRRAVRIALPVGSLQWRLVRFVSDATARRFASTLLIGIVLAWSLVTLAAYALHQRRQRLRDALRARGQMLATSQELTSQIDSKTLELQRASADFGRRYADLQRTERMLRETQDELVQAGKLSMLGQMAAGVTHELTQPLTALHAFSENAVTYLDRGNVTAARENLVHIERACDRMGLIVGQLRGFLRKSVDASGPVDLGNSIANAMLLLERDIERSGASIRLDVQADAIVLADNVRLEQVLINLLRNALDAVRSGARREIAIVVTVGQRVCLRLSDSGPGIPDEVRDHLFEPFFTTKAASQGLGLGLAISSSIVQAMQGELTASNGVDAGAEFVLVLPRFRPAAEDA